MIRPSSSPDARARPIARGALVEAARLGAVEPCRAVLFGHPQIVEIVTAAERVFGSDLAAVVLVGADRLEFSASRGIGSGGHDVETVPRAHALCAEVVQSEAPLLVADASMLPGLRDHVQVSGWGMRAYAGVPLNDPHGYAVGTLCTMSRRADVFEDAVIDDLSAFAALAESVLGDALAHASAMPNAAGLRRRVLGVKAVRVRQGTPGLPGLMVLRVASGSPAEKAGLRPEDTLHSVNGAVLFRQADLRAALEAASSSAVLRFQRRGRWKEVRAVFA